MHRRMTGCWFGRIVGACQRVRTILHLNNIDKATHWVHRGQHRSMPWRGQTPNRLVTTRPGLTCKALMTCMVTS